MKPLNGFIALIFLFIFFMVLPLLFFSLIGSIIMWCLMVLLGTPIADPFVVGLLIYAGIIIVKAIAD